MADYFSEYTAFVGNKGLPSPADTPYETAAIIRSKRSSRATTIGSRSREHSASPPPLPPDPSDSADKTPRDGRYSALDPRRFTPTLHASLVAEILSLRRELDSKNHLVENLETGLASAKGENEQLMDKLAASAKEVRMARTQVQQMESGTYEAVETIAKERNIAQALANDMRLKLDVAHKKAKLQDDDAERTQAIWEREKDSWENERRQLERRVHVTETRLRTFVDEMMLSQQTAQQTPPLPVEEAEDESRFKDSGLGDESDLEGQETAPVVSQQHHNRQYSSTSFKSRFSARDNATTPEPGAGGFNLADELGADGEDGSDVDEFDAADDELDYHGAVRATMESRQSTINGEVESKAKRVLGLTDEVPSSPVRGHARLLSQDSVRRGLESVHRRSASEQSITVDSPRKTAEARPLSIVQELPGERSLHNMIRAQYVDTGYQPSPPQSPVLASQKAVNGIVEPLTFTPLITIEPVAEPGQRLPVSIISSPDTPVTTDSVGSAYADMSTQTESDAEPAVQQSKNRDSLQLPVLVPSISIHPPTSRPATPRQYALPPGTRNASSQASLSWPGVDACIQTEEIRVDRRPVKLPPHLLPSYLLTNLPDPVRPRSVQDDGSDVATRGSDTTIPGRSAIPTSPIEPPQDSIDLAMSRDNSSKEFRSMPLKAIPLPKPILAPAIHLADKSEGPSHGPLNRSAQFGVSHENRASRFLANMDDTDESDGEKNALPRPIYGAQRPSGRFTPSEHPRNVPEDKELSPERRPLTTESTDAAPAPSIASSRDGREAQAQRARKRPPPKLKTYAALRSRSPSFGSVASSSNWSAPSAAPPYPIPTRSSSRGVPFFKDEGSWSPSVDAFAGRTSQNSRSHTSRQHSLRKVQSSTSIRHSSKTKVSPRKGRRRMRSPELTPVQSMAFDSPAATGFPIPELPTPLQHGPASDYHWGSRSSRPAHTSISSMPLSDEAGIIDSIAATMVGEWMWKYIRKRKSFGVGEAAEDFAQTGANGQLDIPGIGSRHKRWVWLSPYEKTIMWDSKQPTSGTALLGKKGRKLMISSVIDVKDESPLPRKPELETAHNRSILILTPARALKFTTTTAERHQYWMTALTFLAESNRMEASQPALAPVPPLPRRAPPPPPIGQRQKERSPSFGRATIRDSVRLAKGKDTANCGIHPLSRSTDSGPHNIPDDGADFPAIPRLYSNTSKHQRKRSNTSPRLPPPLSTLRSFSSTAISSSSSQPYSRPNGSSAGKTAMMPGSSYGGSRGNSAASPDRPNFFEATGTVRMEAFVDPNIKNGVLYVPAPPPSTATATTTTAAAAAAQQQQHLHQHQHQHHPRRRRGNSNLSTTTIDKRRAGYVFDDDGSDPFKGF